MEPGRPPHNDWFYALSLRGVQVASNGGNLGRDKLSWPQEPWNRIDPAVHDEMKRAVIARLFIPVVPVAPDALTVAARCGR